MAALNDLLVQGPARFMDTLIVNGLIYEQGIPLSSKYAPLYRYQTSDPGAGSSLTTGQLLIIYS
jgi:hypothetical protein